MEADKQCILGKSRCSKCDSVDQSKQCCCDDLHDVDHLTLREKLNCYSRERKMREDLFINKLNEKRNKFFDDHLSHKVK